MKSVKALGSAIAMLLFPIEASARIYITAGTDLSTHSYVQFYIEDDLGRRTGQPPTGPEVAEIPGTAGRYGSDSEINRRTNESGPEAVEFYTSSFPSGRFKLILLPFASTSYWLNISIANDNNTSIHQEFSGFVSVGSPQVFNFEHQPTASSPTAVAKVVTLASLRQSVQVALTVGQLGDEAFVSRLDKLLGKAQADQDLGKNKQAADRLDQFIHRLDSAFKKEVDPDDADDPADRKNSGNMKRFATRMALESFSEDARVLIVGFGEKPKR